MITKIASIEAGPKGEAAQDAFERDLGHALDGDDYLDGYPSRPDEYD